MNKFIKNNFLLCIFVVFFLISAGGCSDKGTSHNNKQTNLPVTESITRVSLITPLVTKAPTPTPVPAEVTSIKVIPDPSYEEFFIDPYSQLSSLNLETYPADKELYNYLYKAVENQEESVDVTGFHLSDEKVVASSECLYQPAGLQLYYMQYARCSKDFNTVKFTYTDSGEAITKNHNIFYLEMNHLLYNVAPKDYTPLQRFFSVYDYITKLADYSDNLEDYSTLTVNSILVQHKGICGAYSLLANYVLNFVGVKTYSVSNEPHAWNVVELNGSRYHSDFCWGAGTAGSNDHFINTVLMDDTLRNEGLKNLGYGDYPYYVDYPWKTTPCDPCTDKRYDALKYVYSEYALDIENEYLYYSAPESIHRMKLDGTGDEIIYPAYSYLLACYDGVLYFSGSNTNELYRYIPGKEPELIDDSTVVYTLQIKDGILKYGEGEGSENNKEIDLNNFKIKEFDYDNSKHMKSENVKKTYTFRVEVNFNKNMETSLLPKENIGLVNQSGQLLPIHMAWSEDGKTLTIRSQACLLGVTKLSLYLTPGIADTNGQLTTAYYDLPINIVN